MRLPLAATLAFTLATAAVAPGCRGARSAPPVAPVPPVPAVVQVYDAARWIPARPTYAFAARSVRVAIGELHGLLDSLGALVDLDVRRASGALTSLLAVDPLSLDALSAIGVDVEAGAAVFSEGLSPTLVVRLASPDRAHAFFDRLRAGGIQTRTERVDEPGSAGRGSAAEWQRGVVDGIELTSASLGAGARATWAIADGWLWVHVALPVGRDEGTAWLTARRSPRDPAWTGHWQWALERGGQGERPAFTGFVDGRALLEGISSRVPDAIACAKLLEPVGRIAVALDGDGTRTGARLAIELGGGAPSGIAGAILPAPEGWGAVAAKAPLAAQWNVDLAAAAAWAAPCTRALGADTSALGTTGVRTARAILAHYDPGKPTASRGAVSADLAHRTYVEKLLDEIPGRSIMQRKRAFGPYRGYSIAIPFGGPTIEYVLDGARAIGALGDGLLAAVVGNGAGAPGPLFAVDLAPPAMSREAWAGLLGLVNLSPGSLLGWRELHLAARLDADRLVIDISGQRR